MVQLTSARLFLGPTFKPKSPNMVWPGQPSKIIVIPCDSQGIFWGFHCWVHVGPISKLGIFQQHLGFDCLAETGDLFGIRWDSVWLRNVGFQMWFPKSRLWKIANSGNKTTHEYRQMVSLTMNHRICRQMGGFPSHRATPSHPISRFFYHNKGHHWRGSHQPGDTLKQIFNNSKTLNLISWKLVW